ncbi:MAG: RNA polymerase sigma factor [Saprospiraceae bacterium]
MNKKEQHFKQIYNQSKDKIYRLCLGFTGNPTDADDLFQEILIKVWNNLDSFRKESNINTWIYRIATNTALHFANRNTKSKKRIDSNLRIETLRNEALESKSFYSQDKVNKLYQAISTLKEIDKIIISLLLDNCSYLDIAEVTGISISNVGVRINRLKKILTKKLN